MEDIIKTKTAKTFTEITIRDYFDNSYDAPEKAKQLLFKSILMFKGTSLNILRQNLKKEGFGEILTNLNIQEIKIAREKISEIIEELSVTIGIEDLLIKKLNHTYF